MVFVFIFRVNTYHHPTILELSVSDLQGGGGIWLPQCIFSHAPLKFDFLGIFFIGLKWSLGILRKSPKV
jgi:hypothetical protein